jgi:hypothetical protein
VHLHPHASPIPRGRKWHPPSRPLHEQGFNSSICRLDVSLQVTSTSQALTSLAFGLDHTRPCRRTLQREHSEQPRLLSCRSTGADRGKDLAFADPTDDPARQILAARSLFCFRVSTGFTRSTTAAAIRTSEALGEETASIAASPQTSSAQVSTILAVVCTTAGGAAFAARRAGHRAN